MIELFYTLALAGLMIQLLLFPALAAQGVTQALELCTGQLIPALFPFFVVSSLLVGLPGWGKAVGFLRPVTRAAGVRSSQAPLILALSWVGGYGVCAQSVREGIRRGKISPREGERLLVLGSAASPGFILGSVGCLMLGSPILGWLLLGSCLTGNLATALALNLLLGKAPRAPSPEKAGQSTSLSLTEAIGGGVTSCLSVCGSVLFFRTLWQLAQGLLPLSPTGQALLGAALEVTSGCSLMGELSWPGGCCLALSFLSGSVFLQIAALLEGSCSIRLLLLTRPLHLMFSLGAFRIGLALFPQASQVYSSLAPRLILTSRNPPDLAVLLFILSCLALRMLTGAGRKKPRKM